MRGRKKEKKKEKIDMICQQQQEGEERN